MQRRRVALVVRGPIEALPPILSVAHALSRLDLDLCLVCSEILDENRDALCRLGTRVEIVGPAGTPPAWGRGKLRYWMQFRRSAWRTLDALGADWPLWIGSVETAVCMGRNLLSKRFVLQSNELYDRELRFRIPMGQYLRAAQVVVVPETARGAILRSWFRLRRSPTWLPNKPSYHPRRRQRALDIALDSGARQRLDAAKHIVLYQGSLLPDRGVLPVARAVGAMGTDWLFTVMGREGPGLSALLDANPITLHIPHRSAPDHLSVTSVASVGVLAYDFSSLNNVFCAPNKLWEFAGFGIPVLAQDLPGLRYLVDRFQAGCCVNFDSEMEIRSALTHLVEHRGAFETGATALFDSVDTQEIVSVIVRDLHGA